MSMIPAGLDEAEVLRVIEDAVRILAPMFHVPGLDTEDLMQEARIFGLECLPRYDPAPDAKGVPTRPLANFVYIHIRLRLINLNRNLGKRCDAPCKDCHNHREHEPTDRCRAHKQWNDRQRRKLAVRRPLAIDRLPDEATEPQTSSPSTVEDDAAFAEMLAMIDDQLDSNELRRDYLMIRAGVAVPRPRRDAVERAIRAIIKYDEPLPRGKPATGCNGSRRRTAKADTTEGSVTLTCPIIGIGDVASPREQEKDWADDLAGMSEPVAGCPL